MDSPFHSAITSAITETDAASIRHRGYDVTALMGGASFTDVVFLLHRGELPTPDERRLLDAMLIAFADHGPGSPSALAARVAANGNRRGLEAAVAAGVLAIGDAHGGAGYDCMELIAEGVALAQAEGIGLSEAAARLVERSREVGVRLPGLGHRSHPVDPRTTTLFAMARASGVAGEGVAFMEALHAAVATRIRSLPINVDGSSAAVLFDLGFPPPLAKLLFILGRVGGLTAQVHEELTRERPMRLKVAVEYDGPAARALPTDESPR